MNLPPDVEGFVRQSFATSELSGALQLLEAAVLHDGSTPNHRMLRCAVIASGGSLGSLRRYVACLAADYRDVIVAGEYETRDDELVRVRDLSKPLKYDTP